MLGADAHHGGHLRRVGWSRYSAGRAAEAPGDVVFEAGAQLAIDEQVPRIEGCAQLGKRLIRKLEPRGAHAPGVVPEACVSRLATDLARLSMSANSATSRGTDS